MWYFEAMNILLVEDDHKISEFIKTGLRREGHLVDSAVDGISGLDLARTKKYDLLILDVMLPRLDGIGVLRTLKKEALNLPVIILSAKHSVEDRVLGLDTGADDYLVKPFSFVELLARVNALTRRKSDSTVEAQHLYFGDLVLDRYSRKALYGDKALELQSKEFSLLELFMKNKDRVLSKNFILDRIWNIDFDPQTNVVDVLVCRLRNKLERATGKRNIVTMRGVGYVLTNDISK